MEKESLSTKYYGNYRAKVVKYDETKTASGDPQTAPKQWGRIKVRVYPMMADEAIPVDALPWAVPATPISDGAGEGFGTVRIPRENSFIWVFFENGDPHSPVYFAEAPDGIHGLPDGDDADGDPEWFKKNYPDRKGFQLENGTICYIDEKTNELYVYHPSGTWVKIHGTGGNHGKVEAYCVDELEAEIEKDVQVTVNEGDVTVDVLEGDVALNVEKGDLDVEVAEGDIAVTAGQGDIDVEATLGKITINAKASNVELKADAGIVKIEGGMGVQINP